MDNETLTLTATDGHELQAYQVTPNGTPRGGVVVVQEIFGVTPHIRRVTESYAKAGYLAIAPALFDRIEPGIEVDYSDVQKGRDYRALTEVDLVMLDITAAVDAIRPAGKVGVVGYCWGGGMAYLAACRLPAEAAVAYYGGPISEHLDEMPKCPVMYHFGAQDNLIPPETVASIRQAHPEGVYHIYENSGHGFNCDERSDYNPDDAMLAFERSIGFFSEYL